MNDELKLTSVSIHMQTRKCLEGIISHSLTKPGTGDFIAGCFSARRISQRFYQRAPRAQNIYVGHHTMRRVRPRGLFFGPVADGKLPQDRYTSTYPFSSNKKYVCHGSTFLQNLDGDLLFHHSSFQLERSMCRAIHA